MRVLLLIALCIPLGLSAQDPHPILSYFNANLGGDEVLLTWEIKGGNTCNGIQIYRTTDTTAGWTLIGDIQGTCGSPDFPQPYDFTDPDPVGNAINYYRLELGNQGLSTIASVEYIVLTNNYSVIPNPLTPDSQLHFSNPNNDSYQLEVIDLSGRVIYSKANIQSDQVPLNDITTKGLLIFNLISSNGNTITGKLMQY